MGTVQVWGEKNSQSIEEGQEGGSKGPTELGFDYCAELMKRFNFNLTEFQLELP